MIDCKEIKMKKEIKYLKAIAKNEIIRKKNKSKKRRYENHMKI